MVKKIAVLVRERQKEALRMAVGLILMDDLIDVYILDREVEQTEDNVMNLDTMKEMDMNLYTNYRENEGLSFIPSEVIAEKLLDYDIIVPY